METTVLKGTKLNMSQVFRQDGKVIPVTVVAIEEGLNPELLDKKIKITGTSKGKGFAGAIKRWNFHKQGETRGASNKVRAPGAIGSQTPGRVWPGKKMAGHYGNETVTIKSSKIVKIDLENKKLMVSGPVPGHRNSKVTIKVETASKAEPKAEK